MMADSDTGLFGILPEQMSAARPKGAPRLRKAERRQASMRPISLEDLLSPDHRARFVWRFAERLDLSALYGAIKAVEAIPAIRRPTPGFCWHSGSTRRSRAWAAPASWIGCAASTSASSGCAAGSV